MSDFEWKGAGDLRTSCLCPGDVRDSGIMKAGFIDLLLDSIGWVLVKAWVFALAILTGVGMAILALMAGTAVGGGGFGFAAGSGMPIQEGLMWVLALLPQVAFVFWAGMYFVRSENVEARHWTIIAGLQAYLLTGCLMMAMPGGIFARVVAVAVTTALMIGLSRGVKKFGNFQYRRGLDHFDLLMSENVARRKELKEKFGTVSSSAEDLGIS
jgi:hypothetical protein